MALTCLETVRGLMNSAAAMSRGDDGGKVTRIKRLHVFDVTQTQERTQRAVA